MLEQAFPAQVQPQANSQLNWAAKTLPERQQAPGLESRFQSSGFKDTHSLATGGPCWRMRPAFQVFSPADPWSSIEDKRTPAMEHGDRHSSLATEEWAGPVESTSRKLTTERQGVTSLLGILTGGHPNFWET